MHLSISKSKNKTFYYVIYSFREGDKVTSKRILKIGEHSELLAQGIQDPLAFANEVVEQMKIEEKNNILTITKKYDFSQLLEAHSISSTDTSKNIGWLYLDNLYNQLGLDKFFESLNSKEHYDANMITKYLTIDRILHPRSKLASFNGRNSYLGNFNFKLYDVYRLLTLLDTNNDDLQKTLFENTKKIVDLDSSILYYDCTNYYFESENQDEDTLNEDGDIIQWGLRKYGCSKEHRPNPIVQMGLFVDRNGIPISYCINHGSNNEQNTVIPLEKMMIEKFNQSNFIYCSDAGLGSADNRFFNCLQGRSYVVTQSLKQTKDEELDNIFIDANWKIFTNDDNDLLKDTVISLETFKNAWIKYLSDQELSKDESRLVKYDMIYKIYPIKREVPLKFLKNMGIRINKSIEIEESLYVTFSIKYFLYQQNLLSKHIARAEKLVGSKDISKNGKGKISKLVKSEFITENGESAIKQVSTIDESAVDEESKFNGFYAVASNLETSIYEIININSSRWKIEQSFRILKTDFDARPAYTSTPENIRGHFAICYISLLIYRILERKLFLLDTSNNHFTTNQIISTIRNMKVYEEEDKKVYRSIYTGSSVLDALEKLFNNKLNRKHYNYFTLNKLFNKK